jgi:ketopantoate reductase
MNATTVAVDLAKSVFQVAVADNKWRVVEKTGLKLIWEDGSEHLARPKAVASAAEAGPQDLVILAVKAHFLDLIARDVDKLLDTDTMIMTVQNGMPWWYFQNYKGPLNGTHLNSLDPSGLLTRHIPAARLIGCVVYPAASVTEPGVVKHVEGDRFPLGELDGSLSERAQTLHDLLVAAGFRSRVVDDIRSEIWLKAWGNLSFNPISALTHATLEDICTFKETRQLAATMMAEAQVIGEKLGVTFRHTIEKRIDGAQSVGKHKTSMLQDVEAGRSLETEALIGAILEMGQLVEAPSPAIEAVYACVKLLNKTMLMEHAGVTLQKAS